MRLTAIRVRPEPIAAARIGLGAASILNSVEAFVILTSIEGGRVAIPLIEGMRVPAFPWLVVTLMVGVAAGLAVAVGWRTEVAAAVSASVNVTAMLWDQQMYSSHRLLATLLLVFLVFARSGTAWSLHPAEPRTTVPWWPQLLMMNQLSVCYLFAALSKVNPIFLTGAPLSAWVWIDVPLQSYTIAAVLTVAVELILAIGLWFPSSRRLAAVLGVALHLGIVVFMDHGTLALVSFAITCLCLYPLFFSRPLFRQPKRADGEIRTAGAAEADPVS